MRDKMMMTIRTIPIVLLQVAVLSVSFAQLSERNDKTSASNPSATTFAMPSASLQTGRVVMDGPVDPKEYQIGPGDIFSISIWTSQPMNLQVPVTPEGTVVIPSIAEVRIAGLTLDSAKRTVLAEIRKKIMTGQVTFTLFAPRSFSITVTGVGDGSFTVQASQRIDVALAMATELQRSKEPQSSSMDRAVAAGSRKRIPVFSRRHITVRRRSGTIVAVDIEKYLATGNTLYNPLLQDGDVIILQPKNIATDYIAVYGAVSREGTYEFSDGDSLSRILAIAGGLTTSTGIEPATIDRVEEDGHRSVIRFDARAVLAGRASNIPLKAGDQITIPARRASSSAGTVTVEGEVRSPGTYPIIRDSTTFGQIIALAGGVTPYASYSSSRIIRISSSNADGLDTMRLQRGLSTSENYEYIAQTLSTLAIGMTVQADLAGIMAGDGKVSDVRLQHGDRIVIASSTNSVYVFGEVVRSGFVPWVPGKDAAFYLALAGGVTNNAIPKDIRIIKASTKQWLEPGATAIEEGDYIWVPKDSYRTFSYYLAVYSQVFGIIGTVVSLIILSTK